MTKRTTQHLVPAVGARPAALVQERLGHVQHHRLHPHEATPADPREGAATADWPELAELDLGRVQEVMRAPRIIDARNLLDPHEARHLGFEHACLGRR
jgi:hypothetical protein